MATPRSGWPRLERAKSRPVGPGLVRRTRIRRHPICATAIWLWAVTERLTCDYLVAGKVAAYTVGIALLGLAFVIARRLSGAIAMALLLTSAMFGPTSRADAAYTSNWTSTRLIVGQARLQGHPAS